MLNATELPTYYVRSADMVAHLRKTHRSVAWEDCFRTGDMSVCFTEIESLPYPFDNEWLDAYKTGKFTVQNSQAVMYSMALSKHIPYGLYVITR